jgi:hypothetical protein
VDTGYRLPFADLSTTGSACGTIDYSEETALLFLGHFVSFEELELSGLREELPPSHPMVWNSDVAVQTLDCPNCGGNLERRTGSQAKAMYCRYCGSGIDLTASPYDIFARQKWDGLKGTTLDLGAKGQWEGHEYTVLGMMVREATEWNVKWTEYLLHNRTQGYRWLADADGHWTWYTPLYEAVDLGSGVVTASARGVSCKHLEMNKVKVRKVVGEFYWRVRAGDTVLATDYTNPPFILSREQNNKEVSWSLGKYVDHKQIQQAFGLGELMPPSGISPNQPAPQDKYLKPLLVRVFTAVVILLAWSSIFHASRDSKVVIKASHSVNVRVIRPQTKEQLALASTRWFGPIDVEREPSALKIELASSVSNAWLYFRMALFNEATGEAVDFGEELSYYAGPDWSEGSRDTSVIVPKLKKGRHYLRVETMGGGAHYMGRAKYQIQITNDVPLTRWTLIGLLLLLFPIGILFVGKILFEMQRAEQNS